MSMKFSEQWFKDRFGVDAPAKGGRFTPEPKKPKYGNQKSGKHASRRESRRSRELQVMQRAGMIRCLQEQVKYILVPSQRDEQGKVIERQITYTADFVYQDKDGQLIVEDSKGFKTQQYVIRRKLMLWFHGIIIKEV
jgi:hypothetical protein